MFSGIRHYLANIYLFKVNNRNTRKKCEISSKLTTKNTRTTSMTSFCCFIVNFEHISHLFLVSLLLTLNKYLDKFLIDLVKFTGKHVWRRTFLKKFLSDLFNYEFYESFQNNFYTELVLETASGKLFGSSIAHFHF